ncbi:MAG: YbjN domain-containing protein [Parvularculaceae bacterium]
MSIEFTQTHVAAGDPLDSLEAVAGLLEIESERVDEAELHLAMPGVWRDAGVWFTWRPELHTVQMGAPLDVKVPPSRRAEAARLVALVNERLWIGHFDLWSEDCSIVYRNAVVLPEEGGLDSVQAQYVIKGAQEASDRFFPAFNYFVWGGRTPEEALEAALFETAGNA